MHLQIDAIHSVIQYKRPYNAMRSTANVVIISFTSSPMNHRVSQLDSIIESIKLPAGGPHLGQVHFISFGRMRWGRGHSKMMPCVHNLPLPGIRREDTRAVTVETDNNNIQNHQGNREKYMQERNDEPKPKRKK